MTLPKIIYIIFLIFTVLSCFLFSLKLFYKNRYVSKIYKKYYWKKIYRIALDYDFYLINQFTYNTVLKDKVLCDHLLFGDKYIYFINDYYFNGAIEGELSSKAWVYYRRKEKPIIIDNPKYIGSKKLEILSSLIQNNISIFINISLINDDCLINIDNNDKNNIIIARKNLKTVIKLYESTEINEFNKKELSKAVLDIAAINQKEKKK